jgi:hypothetical protein
MTYKAVKCSIVLRRVVGFTMAIFCFIVIAISILKGLFLFFDNFPPLLANIASPFKLLIAIIYDKTQFLSLIWEKSPILDVKFLLSPSNLWLLYWVFGIFIGLSMFRSANKDSKIIHDELNRNAVRTDMHRTRNTIEISFGTQKETFWKVLHTLYLAPATIVVIQMLFQKLFGLK